MDPLTIAAMGKLLMGAGSVAKPAQSGVQSGPVTAAGSLDSSNWTVSIGSSGGGFAPTVTAGAANTALLLGLAVVGVLLWKKVS